MSDDVGEGQLIRRAIGGDVLAVARLKLAAYSSSDPVLVTVAAVLERRHDLIDRALLLARTSRDRQVVAIAQAHLQGRSDLVDALARDHLVDHPGSVLVAWIASGAAGDGDTTSVP